MTNRFDELKNLIMSLEADFAKFYEKENQTAGTRVRKAMQDLKNVAQSIRLQVQNIKNEKVEAVSKDKPAAAAKPKAPAKPADKKEAKSKKK
ncbi:MAG: hypothetical protein EAZ97_14535 [Bacteroidetes bacterium]|nr:MAG: hypothetical protein EAZ97_14535 [Bacteroidota bacterium]